MPLQHVIPSRLYLVQRALRPSAKGIGFAVGVALGLGGCARPPELAPGAIAGAKAAPWQAQLTLSPPLVDRRLSDGEGEFVMAAAIAAHEKRRP
jgi:hypothetical protein